MMMYNIKSYLFNIVSAQPSTAISWVAAKMLIIKKMYISFTMSGLPVSGNKLSMSLAVYIKINPVKIFSMTGTRK